MIEISKNKKRLMIGSGAILIIGVVLISLWLSRQTFQEPSTLKVQKQTLLEKIEVSGTVISERDITLKALTNGVISKKFIEENQTIDEGQSLIQIDPKDYRLKLNQAQTNLETSLSQARTELSNAQKTYYETEKRRSLTLKNLENQLSKSRNRLKFVEQEFIRDQGLEKEGIISKKTLKAQKQQLDQIRLDVKTLNDQLQKSRAERSDLVAAKSRINQARTSLNNAMKQGSANVALSKKTLTDTTLLAPFDGTLTAWTVSKGAYVTVGTPLGRLQDLKDINLKLSVNELDAPKIKLKALVDIVFDAYPDKKFKGKIIWKSLSSVAQGDVQVFPVKVGFENPGLLIQPGMSGDANILVNEKKDILAIPISAIRKEEKKYYVSIYENGNSTKKEITTGISTLEKIEVLSGLNVNDRLIIEDSE